MKRFILLFWMTSITLGAVAQKNTKRYQQPNKWTIGLNTGITAPYHDVRRNEIGDLSDISFVLGANLSYWLSPAFALRGEMGYGRVGGSIRNAAYLGRLQFFDPAFNGFVDVNTTFFNGAIKGVLNFSGLGLQGYTPDKYERKWNFFGTLGIGAVSYSARTQNISTGQFIWTPNFGAGSGLALAVPVGTGFSFKVSPKFHIDLEVNMHFVNADDFDGLVIQKASGPASGEPNYGRNLDRFATAQIGFVFHLGNNRQGNSKYWNRSYLQQYNSEMTEELNKFDNKFAELNRRNQEQDKQIVALEEKIALLERQMRASEAEMKKDSDGDGVPDIYDKEFTKWDLSGITPSACGWSEAEFQTLREKAARNEKIKVDGAGIALDVDKDGIPDHLDKCPTIAGIPSCHGCKPEPKAETVKILSDLQGIEFESGLSDFVDCTKKRSRVLQDECRVKQEADMENLRNLVAYLNDAPNQSFRLRIVGHTDDVGSAESNMVLSVERAKSVKARLVSMGVDDNRIIAEGRGEDEPKFGPSGPGGTFTVADRNRNRRIELTIE